MSKLSITAAEDIPRKVDLGADAVAGFGWANAVSAFDAVDVVLATIHPEFRDSAQNPDSWHLHAANLDFIDADSACVRVLCKPTGRNSNKGRYSEGKLGKCPDAVCSF